MRHRTTFVLLVLFLAGLGVLWWADYADIPTKAKQRQMLNRLLPELIDTPVEEISRIEVERGAGKDAVTIVVERKAKGSGWQLREPVDASAEKTAIDTLAGNLKDLRKSAEAGTIEDDPARYGLAKPEATVRVFVEGGRRPASTLAIGMTAREKMYVRPGGDAGVEVVDARLLGMIKKPVADWRDTTLFQVPSFQVEGVAIDEARPARKVALRRDERRWRLVSPVKAPADEDKAEGLVAELSAMRVADGAEGFVEDGAKDLAKYGLAKPSTTIVVTPFARGGDSQTVYLGDAVPDKPDQRYAMRGDQDDVVRVEFKRLREAVGGAYHLRSRKVLDVNPPRVERLRVEWLGKVFDVARNERGWELLSPIRAPADATAVQTLLTKLADLEASEFLDPSQVVEPKLDRPTYRIRGWQAESGKPARPAEAMSSEVPREEPRFDLTLGRIDALKRSVFGRLEGDTAVLAIPDPILQALPRNDFAFRDLTVLALKPEQITRVVVEHGAKSITLEAPGSGKPGLNWRVVGPVEAKADESSVTALVMTLANLRAESWESDTLKDPAAYGLDKPRVRVKWTLQGASAGSGVLRIGRLKSGTISHFANIEGDSRVFTLNAGVVAPFDVELRSRTAMAFPMDAAERVSLEWPGRTLALVKGAGSSWHVEAGYDPAGIDGARLALFIKTISDLQTTRYFQYVGPFPALTGLGRPRLEVKVKLTGDPVERVLRVGAPAGAGPGEEAYYATASPIDEGAVFEFAASPAWKDVLEAPRRIGDLPADPFAPAPKG